MNTSEEVQLQPVSSLSHPARSRTDRVALLIEAAAVLWTSVVVYAVVALDSTTAAYVMGAVIALVLGGSQALARSLFSSMVPQGRQASFFGFYELAERGTAWIGTLIFAVVLDVTGSYRGALLSLLVLFVSGGLLLAATDTDAAVAAARATEDTDDPAVVVVPS
jgi:UMF1 family MFS transporter